MVSFWKVDPHAPPALPPPLDDLEWPKTLHAPLKAFDDVNAWKPIKAPVIKIDKIHEPLLLPSKTKSFSAASNGKPAGKSKGGKAKDKAPSKGQASSSSVAADGSRKGQRDPDVHGIDLLSEDMFSDFSSLSNGLLIGGATSACSLNCGGRCEACRVAKRRKKV